MGSSANERPFQASPVAFHLPPDPADNILSFACRAGEYQRHVLVREQKTPASLLRARPGLVFPLHGLPRSPRHVSIAGGDRDARPKT